MSRFANNAPSATADDVGFVEAAYAQSLGRAVDPRALRQGMLQLQQGMSRREFAATLQRSDEARARIDGPPSGRAAELPTLSKLLAVGPSARFVEQAYRRIAGRPPVAEELAAAHRLLAQGQPRVDWLRDLRCRHAQVLRRAALADIHRLDLSAAELAGQTSGDLSRLLEVSDEGFVHLAYWRLLRRPPDRAGRETYLRRLERGEPRPEVLRELMASPEGRMAGVSLDGLGPAEAAARPLRRVLRRVRRRLAALWPDAARTS